MTNPKIEDVVDKAFKAWIKRTHHYPALRSGPVEQPVHCVARGEGLDCCLEDIHESYGDLVSFVAEHVEQSLKASGVLA